MTSHTDPELGKVGEATGTPREDVQANFYQVGSVVACKHCQPEKFNAFMNNCPCKCHSPSQEVEREWKLQKALEHYYIYRYQCQERGSGTIEEAGRPIRELLSQSSTQLLSELIEEIEGMKRANAHLEDGTLQERDNYFYNLALSDIQTLLKKKLNQKEII